jgi:hypothetical protein
MGQLLHRPANGTPAIQAKLMVNAPGDEYEREADRVAEQVMRRPAVQREALDEKDEAPQIRTQREPVPAPDGAFEAGEDFEQQLHATQGRGQPLPAGLREEFEAKFGADFRRVRIHTDTLADRLSQAIQAKAFTTGRDVFFGQGTYEPGSRSGQELIVHELTHVVQQCGQQVQHQAKYKDNSKQTTSMLVGDLQAQPAVMSSERFSGLRIQRTIDTAARALFDSGKFVVEDKDLTATFLNAHGVMAKDKDAIDAALQNLLKNIIDRVVTRLFNGGNKKVKTSDFSKKDFTEAGLEKTPNQLVLKKLVKNAEEQLTEKWTRTNQEKTEARAREQAEEEAAQGAEHMEPGTEGGNMHKVPNDKSDMVDDLISRFNVTSVTKKEAAMPKDCIVSIDSRSNRIDRQGPAYNQTHAKFAVQIGSATYAGIQMQCDVTFTIDHVQNAFRRSLLDRKYIRIFRQ